MAYSIINALKNGSVSSLESKIEEIETTYNPSQFGSFLTNHDQDRIFSELGQNIPKSKLAASILMTLPGVPFLYYGEEVGMIGQKPDENIRRPMQWNSGANGGFSTGSPWYGLNSNYVQYNVESMDLDDVSLLKHYKKWIGYRNLNIALRQGDYQTLDLNLGAALGFLRSTSDQKLMVVHNFSSSAANTVTISASQSSLTAGTYAIRIPESEDTIGNLTVESDGGFSITIDTIEIQAYGSQLFMIE